MTPAVHNQKQTHLRQRFQQACDAWSVGDYELAIDRASQVSEMTRRYRSIDSDLFWYGIRLSNVWSEFLLQEDTRDFNTWAVGQACNALRAAA
ncbi:hypothetical protein [Marinobacter daepoensis]|uniref:hypothetical protein n=1 Tax=Marinobacter daepoensis TaxID=262077 RepID=UPI0003FB2922|nr:hypothetical protein [Marinobacter daepoensis]